MGIQEKWGNLPPFEGDLDKKLKKLRQKLSLYPNVLGAYIFGSRASKRARIESDVDIALITERISAEELTTITSTITQILGTERVDIILLNDVPPTLKFNVISEGRSFYFRNDSIENQFEMYTMKEYWDTQFLRSRQYRSLEEEIREWSLKEKK